MHQFYTLHSRCLAYRIVFRVFLLLLILISSRLLPAQETKVVRDLHLWTGAALEKSWKDWSLTINEEIRFKRNISEINNYLSEAGLRYRINKNFALEGGYRFTRDKNADGSYDNLTRYNLDLRFRGQLEFLTFDYRLRYQKEVEGFKLLDQKADYEKYVRNRIRFRYNRFFRIKPYVSAELFQLFRPGSYPELEYIRVLAGIRYEPGKAGRFNIAFGFNRELRDADPAMIYQFKVNYTYRF